MLTISSTRALRSSRTGKLNLNPQISEKIKIRWNTFNNEDYDKSLYEDEEDAKYERVTAYPFPHMNEEGHANMADYRYRDTLDEYFDIFVIVLR